jgi:hypothetical protein
MHFLSLPHSNEEAKHTTGRLIVLEFLSSAVRRNQKIAQLEYPFSGQIRDASAVD